MHRHVALRRIVNNKRVEVVRDEGMEGLKVIKVTNKVSGVKVSLLLHANGTTTMLTDGDSRMELSTHGGSSSIHISKK
jgi:hypothetical protein